MYTVGKEISPRMNDVIILSLELVKISVYRLLPFLRNAALIKMIMKCLICH